MELSSTHFINLRKDIRKIDEECNYLGGALFFPFKASSLIVITVAESALGVFSKAASFWNWLDTGSGSLSERTVIPFQLFEEIEKELETEQEIEEPSELNFTKLNYDTKYLICNHLSYKDIISFWSTSKELHENFKDRVYRINPNHHLYQIITNLKSSNEIERQLTRYKIASYIAPALNVIGTHLAFFRMDALWISSQSLVGLSFLLIHLFYTVDQVARSAIESYPPRDRDKEGLKQILSYSSHLKDDPILKNYLIEDKVPLLPCRDVISGRTFDFANFVINKTQSNIKNRVCFFDFATFKEIQNRIMELKIQRKISQDSLTLDTL